MIVKIKKYVAKVYNEHEGGTITKEVAWKEVAYDVDSDKLEKFLLDNGKPIISANEE